MFLTYSLLVKFMVAAGAYSWRPQRRHICFVGLSVTVSPRYRWRILPYDLSNGAIFNDLERPLPPSFKVTPFSDALLNSEISNDLEWLSKIFNHTKRRAVSLRWYVFSSVCLCVGLSDCLFVDAITFESFEISSWNFYGSKICSRAHMMCSRAQKICSRAHKMCSRAHKMC